MAVPALALITASGELERKTDTFPEAFVGERLVFAAREHLHLVSSGRLDQAAVALDGHELLLEAVADGEGGRHVLVALLAPDGASGNGAAPNQMLEERFDESPALVWLKDLVGRYIHANGRHVELLRSSEDQLIGRTDAELPPALTVDGPRIARDGVVDGEPLNLEYTVPEFDGRPPLSVLRFAVRTATGDPVGVCGVAAPASQSHLARAECMRLIQHERWGRLDVHAARAEVLRDWGIADPELEPPPEHTAPDVDLTHAREEREALLAERDALASDRDTLATDRDALAVERDSLAVERDSLVVERDSLVVERDSLALQREDLTATRDSLALELDRLLGERDELAAARDAEAAQREKLAAAALEEPLPALGPRWGAGPQHALSVALATATAWRAGLKAAVKAIGEQGGWDAVTAWSRADGGSLGCAAMWTVPGSGLGPFETVTWQHREPAGDLLARALSGASPTWLADLQLLQDRRANQAAGEHMRSALLLPVRDGASEVCLLELLSTAPAPDDPQLTRALEAVAVQLGHFAHLLRLGASPHWRTRL